MVLILFGCPCFKGFSLFRACLVQWAEVGEIKKINKKNKDTKVRDFASNRPADFISGL